MGSEAAESSSAASPQQYNGPFERSTYVDNPTLNLAVRLYTSHDEETPTDYYVPI